MQYFSTRLMFLMPSDLMTRRLTIMTHGWPSPSAGNCGTWTSAAFTRGTGAAIVFERWACFPLCHLQHLALILHASLWRLFINHRPIFVVGSVSEFAIHKPVSFML